MAVERDFELLDDYLAGRLDGKEKLAFEDKLGTDPELKSEYELQQQLVNGVKNVRIAELKAIMNNVPVSALHGGETTVASKLAIWTVVVGLVVTGVYLYLDREKEEVAKPEMEVNQAAEQPVATEDEKTDEDQQAEKSNEDPLVSSEDASSEQKPSQLPKAAKGRSEEKALEPAIDVFDPTEEATEDLSTPLDGESKAPTLSQNPSLAVEIDSKNKKYDFHYQFKGGKLMLYGPFEQNLYEIMEFIGEEKRTVFLYYQENFYLLKDDTDKLKPLGVIQDQALIRKLKEYRKN